MTLDDVVALFAPKPIVYALHDQTAGDVVGVERLENGQLIVAMSQSLIHKVEGELMMHRRARLRDLADVRYDGMQSSGTFHLAVRTSDGFEDRPIPFAELAR